MVSVLRVVPWLRFAAPAVAGPAASCVTRPSRICAPGPDTPADDEGRP
jgi:hypothetical protein